MDRGRALLGVVLLGIGGVLFADRAGAVDAGQVLADWWPLVVIAAGLLRLGERPVQATSGRRSLDVAGAAPILAVGGVLLAWRQDLFGAGDLALLVPVVLIAAGAWVMLRPAGTPPTPVASGTLDAVAVFGNRQLRADGARFDGGRVVALFGSAELDLRHAVLPGGGATLDVVTAFGGVDVTLPMGWAVRVSGPAVLGGVDDRTLGAPAGAPVLDVRTTAVLGGVVLHTDAYAHPHPGAHTEEATP